MPAPMLLTRAEVAARAENLRFIGEASVGRLSPEHSLAIIQASEIMLGMIQAVDSARLPGRMPKLIT